MRQQVNLFQPIFRQERKILSFDVVLQFCLIMVAAMGLVYGYGQWHTMSTQEQLARLQTMHTNRLALLAEIDKKISSGGKVAIEKEQIALLEQELKAKKYLLNTMYKADKAYASGFSHYLEIFSKHMLKGMWLTGFSFLGGGTGMEIRGGAMKPGLILEFLDNLSKESILAGMDFNLFQVLREDPDQAWVEFTLNTGQQRFDGKF